MSTFMRKVDTFREISVDHLDLAVHQTGIHVAQPLIGLFLIIQVVG